MAKRAEERGGGSKRKIVGNERGTARSNGEDALRAMLPLSTASNLARSLSFSVNTIQNNFRSNRAKSKSKSVCVGIAAMSMRHDPPPPPPPPGPALAIGPAGPFRGPWLSGGWRWEGALSMTCRTQPFSRSVYSHIHYTINTNPALCPCPSNQPCPVPVQPTLPFARPANPALNPYNPCPQASMAWRASRLKPALMMATASRGVAQRCRPRRSSSAARRAEWTTFRGRVSRGRCSLPSSRSYM